MEVNLGIGSILVIIAIFAGIIFGLRALTKASARQTARMKREMLERMETLFTTGFPELQPHFHPKNVFEYAQARKASSGPFRWRNPPGFALATNADVQVDGLRDKVRLLDAKDAVLAEFIYEEHAEGAVLRVGKGKFTVGLKGPEPRVRYWHPDRDFKWTPTSWNMKSGLAEQPLRSRGSSTTDHDDDTSSDWSTRTSTIVAGTAAGAGVAAAAAAGEGDSAPDFSGVESGSSSTSTSY